MVDADHSPMLRMSEISKRFGGVQALQDVTLEVAGGEIHAVVGENGAGKSTLMKILSGLYAPDAGRIEIAGEPVVVAGTQDSQARGIAMVYQDFDLASELSVAENIFLGRQPVNRLGFVRRGELHRRAKEVLDRLESDLDPGTIVRGLSAGRRQLVQIAQACSLDPRIIVFDEPTSALTEHEVESLFAIIRGLKSYGVAVLYVSHRLVEVLEIADRVTALRDGRLVGTRDIGDVTQDDLVNMIVGRKIVELFPKQVVSIGEPVLEVEGMTRDSVFEDVSFEVHAGEIVGMAGLVGAGRTEIARSIFGLDKRTSGVVKVNGDAIPSGRVDLAIRAGIGFVPEERKTEGLVLDETISENLILSSLKALSRLGIVDRGRERATVKDLIARLDVRPPEPSREVLTLSGGNQQKVVLGKCLALSPKVLILDEPTAGIDVASKAEIHKLMGQLAANGVAILLISSELIEIVTASDRVLVVFDGRIVRELSREEATEERIIQAATGGVAASAAS